MSLDSTLILTIDLEEWHHSLEPDPQRRARLEKRSRGSVLTLLEMLERRSSRATFFILGEVARDDPDLVRTIAAAGHEIGSHGFNHEFIRRRTPEAFRRDLALSLDRLSSLTGKAVEAYRAPYFSVTRNTLWALDILVEAGIHYDSSIFPVRNPRYGIPDAPRLPFHPRPGLLEWPVSTLPSPLGNLPFAGGAYFRILPWSLINSACTRAIRMGEPLLFYLHPWEIDPDQPRYCSGSRFADLRHYHRLKCTAGRLERLLILQPSVPLIETARKLYPEHTMENSAC